MTKPSNAPEKPDADRDSWVVLGTEETEAIRRLLKRLPQDNRVWFPAFSMVNQQQDWGQCIRPLVDVPRLTELLNRSSLFGWRKSVVAAWLLGRGRILPEQQEHVVQTLCAVLDHRSPRNGQSRIRTPFWRAWREAFQVNRWIGWLLATLCFAILFGLVLQNEPALPEGSGAEDTWLAVLVQALTGMDKASHPALFDHNALNPYCALLLLFLMPLVTFATVQCVLNPLYALLKLSRDRRVRVAAATALGHFNAPEGLGALTSAALEDSAKLREAAEKSLKRLLPTLTADHYGTLEARVVPNLCRLLRKRFDLGIEILHALGKVGDGRAVDDVRRLAGVAHEASVREAAEAILPILLERQRQETAQQTLLRASTGAETPPETLLRPAAGAPAAESEQLLRPGF